MSANWGHKQFRCALFQNEFRCIFAQRNYFECKDRSTVKSDPAVCQLHFFWKRSSVGSLSVWHNAAPVGGSNSLFPAGRQESEMQRNYLGLKDRSKTTHDLVIWKLHFVFKQSSVGSFSVWNNAAPARAVIFCKDSVCASAHIVMKYCFPVWPFRSIRLCFRQPVLNLCLDDDGVAGWHAVCPSISRRSGSLSLRCIAICQEHRHSSKERYWYICRQYK